MLKIIHTEDNFQVEILPQPLEEWLGSRVLLSVRAKNPIFIEPITRSFPVKLNPYLLTTLEQNIKNDKVKLEKCDPEFVDIVIEGSWVSFSPHSELGIFVTTLNEKVECILHQLWLQTQSFTSVNI
jgi:hypothetical protein